MKWGLRTQLMLPVSTLSFVTLFGMGIWLAWQYASDSQRQIESRMAQLASTIRQSSIPINQGILQQLKGLSGAEFIVCKYEGEIVLATNSEMLNSPTSANLSKSLLVHQPARNAQDPQAGTIFFDDHEYLWLQVPKQSVPRDENQIIHVLFPMAAIVRQRWQAIPVILMACLIAWLLSILVTTIIAGKIAEPLKKLHQQVKSIAAGDFVSIPVPQQPVEVKELVDGVNKMSTQLQLNQDSIRESERLKTLSVLGGGIAHQLRNSATGALLALSFVEQGQSAEANEGLVVAKRQLQLMEKYVQKFLRLQHNATSQFKWLSFQDHVAEVEVLVRPFAKHHEVELKFEIRPEVPVALWADPDSLQDMLLNLLLNGIQAASGCSGLSAAKHSARRPLAEADLHRFSKEPSVALIASVQDNFLVIDVCDTGPGLSTDIEKRLFEPFATDRLNGIGLGLYLTQQSANLHQGCIRYFRQTDKTCFSVRLPLLIPPSAL